MADIGVDRVTKSFGSTQVLNGISLDIRDGEFVSLVGPSGCGKSTLLRIIAGLEPQTAGHVRIGGGLVDGMRPSRRNLAMVFQSYALYPHLTAYDNIAVPLRMRQLTAWQRLPLIRWLAPGTRATERAIREQVEQAADLLGMRDLLHRKPGQLSGGQRQRVAVGRAIVREPSAFLLDEPLSNLDAKLRVHMRTEIAQLHRALEATFIYVTHDQAEAMTMSDRIAVLMDGDLVQVGTPAEVYNDPQDIRVAEFIGSPKINVFPAEIRSDGGIDLLGQPTGLVAEADRGEARVGVRPEALRRTKSGDGALAGTVTHVENLGAELMVHFALEGAEAPAIMRLDQAAMNGLAIGDSISVDFPLAGARVFARCGARVAARPLSPERAPAKQVAHV
ncbi:MAG: ABC transporter ATP-binding protein [Hyphomicrobiales bacterium]|nr:ABC transporter ATP-binding protein [Hyphomicrobiales bacterium]